MDRQLLNRATNADEEPTPGYLYSEIAKITFVSADASWQLEEYLTKKLAKNHPATKSKVLKIIRHVCDQGKPDFKRSICRRADLIKECLQYRGDPHPTKGDVPSREVRQEAELCLKAIFATDTNVNAAQGRINGFGSSHSTGIFSEAPASHIGTDATYKPAGGMPSGSRMEGFGNPRFEYQTKESRAASGAGRVSDMVTGVVNKIASKLPVGAQAAVEAWSGGVIGGQGLGGSEHSSAAGDMSIQSVAGGRGVGRYQSPQIAVQSTSAVPTSSVTSANSYVFEKKLVDEVCVVGGARVAPDVDTLNEFCRKCESLDPSVVGGLLMEKLNTGDWQIQLKVLWVIESLVAHSLDAVSGYISEHAADVLKRTLEIPQCKSKASKVLPQLGLVDINPTAHGNHAELNLLQEDICPETHMKDREQKTAAATVVDLLDVDPVNNETASSSNLDGLFHNLQVIDSGSISDAAKHGLQKRYQKTGPQFSPIDFTGLGASNTPSNTHNQNFGQFFGNPTAASSGNAFSMQSSVGAGSIHFGMPNAQQCRRTSHFDILAGPSVRGPPIVPHGPVPPHPVHVPPPNAPSNNMFSGLSLSPPDQSDVGNVECKDSKSSGFSFVGKSGEND